MSFIDRLLRWTLPLVPPPLVRRISRRYIAGEALEDALRVVRQLGGEGAMATLDVLGEEVHEPGESERAVAEYLRALEAIRREGLDCNISVKPTQFGLRLDQALCRAALDRVAARAAELGVFVRIDMEDHSTVDATLRLYHDLQARHGNLGLVLQARLRRTLGDLRLLLPRRPNVRLCKGIYREPRSRAWLDPEIVRDSFRHSLEQLLGSGSYVGIATHDERLVWAGMSLCDRLGLAPDRYEFQMLLGVDPELRRLIIKQGHRLRVYVPYGVDWYRYSLRRLQENPSIAGHVLRALFSRQPARLDPAGPPPRALPAAAQGRDAGEDDGNEVGPG